MRSRHIGLLLAAATLLTTILTGSATADTSVSSAGSTSTTAESNRGWTKLALSVYSPRRDGGATVLLECRPAGGTHPNARQACRELRFAGGDFDKLPGSPDITACTMHFRPVFVSARGLWRGEWVRWHHRYPNRCAMRADTGAVFNF
jgi:hypothetical protein